MTTRRIPLRDLVPRGPVVSKGELAALLAADGPSGVAYEGAPAVGFPLPPVQVFGIRYDLDLVLVDEGPSWDMHEYARIDLPSGSVWLCKDTVDGTLEQTIVADLDGIEHVVPEIPLRRRRSHVEVVDRSGGSGIDLVLRYTNLDDRAVEVAFRGPSPLPAWPRNSSTMGHSRAHVLAALDISRKGLATRASIAYDGEPARLYRIAHLVPFAVSLVQTQAGFSVGRFTVAAEGDGVATVHASGARQAWTVEEADDTVALVQVGLLRTIRYVFRRDGDALELTRAEVWPARPGPPPACVVRFVPSIPDLRRPFRGGWEGRYVVEVGGRAGHAVGAVRVERAEGLDRVHLLPTAPQWTVDRPMVATIRREHEGYEVAVERVDT